MASIQQIHQTIASRSWPSLMPAIWRRRNYGLAGIATVLVTAMMFHFAANMDLYQNDLKTYYLAGKAYEAGSNPYDLSELSRQEGGQVDLPYVYPPYALPLFSALARMEFETVYIVYLTVKVVALGGLFWIWKRWFVPNLGLVFGIFALLAFNAAVLIDIRAGNVSLFEQIMIWLGFGLLIKRKWLGFAIAIAIASSLKLAPLAFIALLFVPRERTPQLYFLGIVLFFIFAQSAAYFWNPDLYLEFLRSLTTFNERGAINPSTLSFVEDVSNILTARAPVHLSGQLSMMVAGVISIGAILLTVRAVAAYQDNNWESLSRFAIFVSCMLFVLVMPRMKTYSYILILVPTFASITAKNVVDPFRSVLLKLGRLGPVIVICMFSMISLATYKGNSPALTLVSYSPLYVAAYIWYRYLKAGSNQEVPPTSFAVGLDLRA